MNNDNMQIAALKMSIIALIVSLATVIFRILNNL